MSNDTATALMRAFAEDWYAAHGARHVYSGLVHGLSAVLHEQGVNVAPMELSNILHDPLCCIDPHVLDVSHIARAVDAALTRDGGPSYWVDPSLHWAYRSRGALVDWSGLALEIKQAMRQAKIRRGTKRAAEFYASKRETVVSQIRAIVANAINARVVGAMYEATKIRGEIAPIQKKSDYLARLIAIRAALFVAAGRDVPTKGTEILDTKMAEYARQMAAVEAAAAYVERGTCVPDELFREGMAAHDELAPFLEAP